MNIRRGIIQKINYEKCTITATFQGADDYSLEDIQVPQMNNKSFRMPNINDSCIVIFDEDGNGFAFGGIYSEAQMPPSDKNDLIIDFEGNKIIIDLEEKTINIETTLDIIAKCKSFSASATENITIKAKKIIFDGEVETTKSIKAGIDVKTGSGVSLLGHTHVAIALGAPTSAPAPGGA